MTPVFFIKHQLLPSDAVLAVFQRRIGELRRGLKKLWIAKII